MKSLSFLEASEHMILSFLADLNPHECLNQLPREGHIWAKRARPLFLAYGVELPKGDTEADIDQNLAKQLQTAAALLTPLRKGQRNKTREEYIVQPKHRDWYEENCHVGMLCKAAVERYTFLLGFGPTFTDGVEKYEPERIPRLLAHHRAGDIVKYGV